MASWVEVSRRKAAQIGRAAMELLFPPRCELCDVPTEPGGDGILLCPDCRLTIGPAAWQGCSRCGALGRSDASVDGCGECRRHRLQFDLATSLGAYQDPLRAAVLKMKRPAGTSVAAAMGHLLAHRRGSWMREFQPDLIVPIPMYWRRRFVRRINSPEILAETLGRRMRVRVGRRVLACCRNTLPQKGLPLSRRFQNVRGVFRVRARNRLQGLRVLLVDDILTTGATCSEAAKMLKQAGADTVAAAVIARSQRPDMT